MALREQWIKGTEVIRPGGSEKGFISSYKADEQ